MTDGQGWTKTGYDAQGRAIKTTRYLNVNSKSYTTQTAYDAADRVTQVTYPNNRAVVAYSYDEAGHQIKAESLWGTGLNEVFYQVSSFNRFGSPTATTYGNGIATQYEFYDRTNRLKRTYTHKDSTSLMDLRYTFDKASNIRNVFDQLNANETPQSLGLSNIQYDDLYRIKSAQPGYRSGQLNYTYDKKGNILTNGELGSNTYVYGSSKPHAVTAVGNNTYSYDACGNMITRNRAGKANQSLTYDSLNRLVQVQDANTVQFGYSAGDSRLWKKFNGQVTGVWIGSLYEEKDGKILCHVYAGGQIVATFEPQGYFACIVENQPFLAGIWHGLTSAMRGLFGNGHMPVTVMCGAALAGIVLGLRYNRKRLWEKYGIETYYGIPAFGGRDPWRQMVLLCLAGSIFLSGMPQSAMAGTPSYDPVFYYYHADHLGSSSIMTDRQGNVVQRYGYTPFGKERYKDETPAFSVSSRYTGQTLDEETGLYYYGARYYDPEIVRFIQADTVVPDPGFSQAYNRYAYVYNNPIKFTDPTGQEPFTIIALIAAAVKGAIIGAYVGMGVALVTGGDPGKGFLAGMIGGFCGGMGGYFGTVGAFIGSVAGGALGAMATGGDPMMGAVTAGISFGVQAASMQSLMPGLETAIQNEYIRQLAVTTFAGAMAGGITAEAFGGNFWQGAAYGAAGAAAGCAITAMLCNHAAIIDWIQSAADGLYSATKGIPGINIATAIAADTICGPVDEMIVRGTDLDRPISVDNIKVKAYRLNELMGYSWAPRKNEIHVGRTVFNDLKSGRGYYGGHISHEIGHVFQRLELRLLYYATVVPLTFPASGLDLVQRITNVPLHGPFHYYEDNATRRGVYQGVK